MKSLIKKLLLGSLSLVFAFSLTFGLGGALKAFAEGKTKADDLFTDAHVTLTEDIVVKFDYTVPAGYTAATYAFTYRNEATETKTATVSEGKNTIEFAEANPARTGETIAVALTLSGDGKTTLTDTCEFTVADYLDTLLTAAPSSFETIKTQEQYVAMRTLAANLVNYSAKTQEYIGLEDSSSALLKTETVKNFVGSEQPAETDLAVGALENTAKYGFIGANLSLDGKVSVNFYFVAESKENLKLEIAFDGGSTATLTEIEEATEIAVKEGVTAYKAVLSGVSAQDLDKKFTAKLLSNGTAVGNEVTYSVKSYAYAMLSSKNDKMKSLALALYNYGLSAKSYVEAMKVTGTDVQLPETKTIEVTDDKYPASFVSEKAFGWAALEKQSYAHSLVADGNGYMYTLTYNSTAANASGDSDQNTSGDYYNTYRIVKLDMNGNVKGYTKTFVGAQYSGGYYWGGVEYFIPLWVKDGYVYSYNGDGKTVRIATTAITENGVDYEVVDAVQFGTIEPKNVKGVVYNAMQQKYAVYTLQTLYIFDEADLTEATCQQSIGINKVRMGGNDNNLYFVESTDNVYAPNITVYDWTGVKGTGISILNKESLKNVKIQGITEYNGVIYYQLIGWNGGVNAVYKCDCSAKKYDLNDYGLGKYLLNCEFETTASTLTNGWNTTNGAYIFNAIEKNGWVYEYRSVLRRYDPVMKVTIATAPALSNQKVGWDENVAMFTYGDKIYVYDSGDKVWKSLPLLFKSSMTWTTEESLPIDLGAYASSFRNIYVFEDTGNVAVFTGSKIVLLDSNGAEKASYAISTSDVSRMGGGKGGYIYYTANAQGAANPTVYVIDTKNGRRTTLSLPNVSENPSTSKISSIFELNGTLCYSLFKWGNGSNSTTIQCVKLSNLTYAAPHKEAEELTNAN